MILKDKQVTLYLREGTPWWHSAKGSFKVEEDNDVGVRLTDSNNGEEWFVPWSSIYRLKIGT